MAALSQAVRSLESTSLMARISHVVGMPIEKAFATLPGHWSVVVTRITKSALEKALDGALLSLKSIPVKPTIRTHKLLVCLSGAVGGSFGITALSVEAPDASSVLEIKCG